MNNKSPKVEKFFIDAVADVLSSAMSVASSSLSQIIDRDVQLSISGIDFVSRLEATEMIAVQAKTNVSGVLQSFWGALSGDAMILFPEEQSLQLVRVILQEDSIALKNLTDREQEAMAEVGNVILNACLCGMADLCGEEILGGIPEFVQGSLRQVFAVDESNEYPEAVVLLRMRFSVVEKDIQGYVTLLMDVDSIPQFKAMVKPYLDMSC